MNYTETSMVKTGSFGLRTTVDDLDRFDFSLDLCGTMLSISHRLGDWTQLRAQAAYGVAFSGITWTSMRNTSWRTVVEKVSDFVVSFAVNDERTMGKALQGI